MQNHPTPPGEDLDLHFGMLGEWTPIKTLNRTLPKKEPSSEEETKKAAL